MGNSLLIGTHTHPNASSLGSVRLCWLRSAPPEALGPLSSWKRSCFSHVNISLLHALVFVLFFLCTSHQQTLFLCTTLWGLSYCIHPYFVLFVIWLKKMLTCGFMRTASRERFSVNCECYKQNKFHGLHNQLITRSKRILFFLVLQGSTFHWSLPRVQVWPRC